MAGIVSDVYLLYLAALTALISGILLSLALPNLWFINKHTPFHNNNNNNSDNSSNNNDGTGLNLNVTNDNNRNDRNGRNDGSSNDAKGDDDEIVFGDIRIDDDLSFAFRGSLQAIPLHIAENDDARFIKKIDCTECDIRDLSLLNRFSSLETLVLDKNNLITLPTCPPISTLRTLWCNNNAIINCVDFLLLISEKFPGLSYLSLMRNPGVPDVTNETSIAQLLLLIEQNPTEIGAGEVSSRLDIGTNNHKIGVGNSERIEDSKLTSDDIDVDDDANELDNGEDKDVVARHKKMLKEVQQSLESIDVFDDFEVTESDGTSLEQDYVDSEDRNALVDEASKSHSYRKKIFRVGTRVTSNNTSMQSHAGAETLPNGHTNASLPAHEQQSELTQGLSGAIAKDVTGEEDDEYDEYEDFVVKEPRQDQALPEKSTIFSEEAAAEKVFLLYRAAVLSIITTLKVLDGQPVTEQEIVLSRAPNALDILIRLKQLHAPTISSADKSTTSSVSNVYEWRWPEGFQPPPRVTTDPEKMRILTALQKEFDDHEPETRFREKAMNTYWDVNNKTLLRYLEAAEWKPKFGDVTIYEWIMETINWRLKYPMPVQDTEILTKGLVGGAMNICGFSRIGMPCIYLVLSLQQPDPDVNIICLTYLFERAIQMLPPALNEYILVIDCDGMGFGHIPPISHISKMSLIFARHLPRRLGSVYVVNGGMLVNWAYDIISRYLSDVTKEKVKFVAGGPPEMRIVMGKEIDPSVLPSKYGGDCEYTFNLIKFLYADPYLSKDKYDPRRILYS